MAYLTIDDAPSARFEEKLDFLISEGIPAAFFCEGRAISGREEALARALRSGYRLGNHSFSHPRFSALSLAACVGEIESTDALLREVHGLARVPWERKLFRFPFLDRGGTPERERELQAVLLGLGYRAPAGIGESADTGVAFDQMDYRLGAAGPEGEPDGPLEAAAILARIDASRPGPADVILIHDHEGSHELFLACIDAYLARGLRFEALP